MSNQMHTAREEIEYWNSQYLEITGVTPNLTVDSHMIEVHNIMSFVMRHQVEKLKKVINDVKPYLERS